MSKILAIIAQKGGVGKTMLAVHLAFAAAMQKKAVLFLSLAAAFSPVDPASITEGEVMQTA